MNIFSFLNLINPLKYYYTNNYSKILVAFGSKTSRGSLSGWQLLSVHNLKNQLSSKKERGEKIVVLARVFMSLTSVFGGNKKETRKKEAQISR